MDREANYALVGFFVLLFSGALLGFILWMGKYGIAPKEYDYYTTFFDESVSGLNIDTPIKFKGLNVGVIEEIRINEQNQDVMEILFKVKKGTPIKTDSYIVKTPLGITGLSFLEIKGGGKDSQKIDTSKGRGVVAYQRSFISKISESADSFAEKGVLILDKLDRVLNDKNIENLEILLENGKELTASLKRRSDELKSVLQDISNLSKDTRISIQKIPQILEEANRTLNTASNTIEKIEVGFVDGVFDIKEMSKESASTFNETLEEIKVLSVELQGFVHINVFL